MWIRMRKISFHSHLFSETESSSDLLEENIEFRPVLWIRIRIKMKGRIRISIHINGISWIQIRIKVISWIRIRITLQMTSQNVWKMSLFEHFFKFLSLCYLEARIRIRTK
jgi:hypothetical protein